MRLVNNPLQSDMNKVLGNPSVGLQGLDQAGSYGFNGSLGVMYAQSHDNDYASRRELQFALYLTRAGIGSFTPTAIINRKRSSQSGGAFPGMRIRTSLASSTTNGSRIFSTSTTSLRAAISSGAGAMRILSPTSESTSARTATHVGRRRRDDAGVDQRQLRQRPGCSNDFGSNRAICARVFHPAPIVDGVPLELLDATAAASTYYRDGGNCQLGCRRHRPARRLFRFLLAQPGAIGSLVAGVAANRSRFCRAASRSAVLLICERMDRTAIRISIPTMSPGAVRGQLFLSLHDTACHQRDRSDVHRSR